MRMARKGTAEGRAAQAQARAADEDELVPIDEVARRFGIQASALRYYERRGLLEPAARRGRPALVRAG
jgi:MerR-like DNA binding protein